MKVQRQVATVETLRPSGVHESAIETAKRHLPETLKADAFDDIDFAINDKPALIEPGEYDAIVTSCKRIRRFGRDLLAFTFRIVSQGPAFDAVVPGYANLTFQHRKVIAGRSKIAAWLRRIHVYDHEVSPSRLKLRLFAEFLFRCRVETTIHDSQQQPLSDEERYSQVTDIVEVIGRLRRT